MHTHVRYIYIYVITLITEFIEHILQPTTLDEQVQQVWVTGSVVLLATKKKKKKELTCW